jgi:hypothetical protein
MAGTRHHIIPKFLLKGFASKQERNQTFAWVFRKERAPFETNIDNIGVENEFYGKDGADEVITEAEGEEFSGFVESLRKITATAMLEPESASKLIAHLMVRTRALRQSFLSGTNYLSEHLQNRLLTGTYFEELLEHRVLNHPQTLLASAEWMTTAQKQAMVACLQSNISKVLICLRPQISACIKQYFAEFGSLLPDRIQEAHNRALIEQVSPQLRVDELCRLRWYLLVLPEPHLIIADVGPISRTVAGVLKYFTDKNDEIAEIFLPICVSRVLVGTRQSESPDLSSESLNEISAKCSFEHFASARNGTSEAGLHKMLGEDADIFPAEMLNGVLKSVLSGLLPDRTI